MSTADLPAAAGEISLLSSERRAHPGTHALKHALLTSLPLALIDVTTSVLAMFIAAQVMSLGISGDAHQGLTSFLPLIGAQLLIFTSAGLYPGVGLNPIVELRLLSWSTALTYGVCIVAAQLAVLLPAGTTAALLFSCCFSLILLPLTRGAVRSLCSNFEWWGQRVLIFGSGPAALAAYRDLQANKAHGLRPIGLVDDASISEEVREAKCFIGSTNSAIEIAARNEITWAMVVMPERSQQEVMQVVNRFSGNFPHLLVATNMQGMPCLWTSSLACAGMAGFRVNERLLLPLPRLMKRLMDLGLIVVALPLLLPVFAVVSFLIKRNSPGPIFYCQKRIGRDGQPFYAWKFRSMVQNAEVALAKHLAVNPEARAEWNLDHKLRDDPRITKIGKFLRKTSLDELPQLWNVFRGEMSLVGPRPIVEAEISKYAENFELYTKVKPGITGMWQISGRNDTSYDERVEHDAFYSRNWSPFLDIYILARTIKVVLLREGAY
jgi:Undecaprenyl-phosphate galactose phosphotransferase WbaP